MSTPATARSAEIIRGFPPSNDRDGDDQVREDAMVMATVYQAANRGLAQRLHQTQARKLYEAWGYRNHKDYASRELRLKPQEYQDLLTSNRFLQEHEPEIARRATLPAGAPPPDVVSMIAKAMDKGTITARDYQKEHEALWSPKVSDEDKRDRIKELTKPLPKIKPETVQLHEIANALRKAAQRAGTLSQVPAKLKQEAAHLAEAFEKLASKHVDVDLDV